VFEVNINFRKLDRLYPELNKAVHRMPQRLKTSISLRLRNAVLREIQARKSGHGVTGRLENPANWRVSTRDTGPDSYSTFISNDAAVYALYLNEPIKGPYPLNINLAELRSWIMRRTSMTASWQLTKAFAETIRKEGHQTHTWDLFIEHAGMDALGRASRDFNRIMDAEINQIHI